MSTKDVVLEITRSATDTPEFFYTVGHEANEYRWPSEALIHQVRIDASYLHVELIDGRNLSVPLSWIPTLHEADASERLKYSVSRDRKLIVWDPFETGTTINEIVRISDYLGPSTREKRLANEA